MSRSTTPPLLLAAVLAGGMSLPAPAVAQGGITVECHSVNFKYAECRAPLHAPQLVHQLSNAPCIVNNSWGFNRKTGYLWVADGCAGVFADASGYHYGMRGGSDPGARQYNDRGHDLGAMAAGMMFGAMLNAGASSSHEEHHYTYSNFNSSTNSFTNSNYDGPHGMGALVDNPDRDPPASQEVDPTVQKFDKDGNPNYDADGNYIGGHGLGTLVDNPDAGNDASEDDSPSD